MKTTRSIDEITTEVKIGCTDAMGGVHKVYIPLTEEAKAELLATILASMPEKKDRQLHSAPNNGELMDDFVSLGYNQALTAVEQTIKKIFKKNK